MNQQEVLRILAEFGLKKSEIQVYFYLGKKGPQKGKQIAKMLQISRQHIYIILKRLQMKGIITLTLEHPASFSALPFEKVIDLYIKNRMQEINRLEGEKPAILSDWKSFESLKIDGKLPKFSVLQGREYIYSRLKQMIEETKEQLSVISTIPDLLEADKFGVLDAAFSHVIKSKVRFRFLTEMTEKEKDLRATKYLLDKKPKSIVGFEGRTPELGIKLKSGLIIRDEAEAAFFIGIDDPARKNQNDTCLWTNSSSLIKSFRVVFEDLWSQSTNIEKRIKEIETGNIATRHYVISDPDDARKKYEELLNSACTEIVVLASAAEFLKENSFDIIKGRAEKGLTIKIMVPITNDNLKEVQHLSKHCRVRHVPKDYLAMTIIDGKHLFEFKKYLPSDQEEKTASFENTFYTNDLEYIEKNKKMLDEVWKNAVAPSNITLEQIMKPPTPMLIPVSDNEYTFSRNNSVYQRTVIKVEEKIGTINEEYVLNKIINAKRTVCRDPLKDVARFYGKSGSAEIHPPNSFKLPDMYFFFYQFNKQSSFGAEDFMCISLLTETPNGNLYIPAAIVGDNAEGMKWRKLSYLKTPASRNCYVLEKDQFQIQVIGNTFFAGWVVPIPLFPRRFVLPPASILIEGYGKNKCVVITSNMPSNAITYTEGIGQEAFVTFFHPESKYAGPGTDGLVSGSLILTIDYSGAAKHTQDFNITHTN